MPSAAPPLSAEKGLFEVLGAAWAAVAKWDGAQSLLQRRQGQVVMAEVADLLHLSAILIIARRTLRVCAKDVRSTAPSTRAVTVPSQMKPCGQVRVRRQPARSSTFDCRHGQKWQVLQRTWVNLFLVEPAVNKRPGPRRCDWH